MLRAVNGTYIFHVQQSGRMSRLAHVLSLKVSPRSLICRPYRDNVSRVMLKSEYTPRWIKSRKSLGNKSSLHDCCVRNCNNTAFVSSTLGTSDRMKHVFDTTGLKCDLDVIPIPMPLCKYHYHILYDNLHFRTEAVHNLWHLVEVHRSQILPQT